MAKILNKDFRSPEILCVSSYSCHSEPPLGSQEQQEADDPGHDRGDDNDDDADHDDKDV